MPLNISYKLGVRREVVNALRPVFGDNYPDEQLRNRVFVSSEFPLREQQYPAIFVTFSEGPIRNAGIGHVEFEETEGDDPFSFGDNQAPRQYAHWLFSGALNFNILAKTPEDRDVLSAGLIQIIGMAAEIEPFNIFYKEIGDNDWIELALLAEEITPGGDSTSPAPWDPEADENIFIASYSVPVFGEFYSDLTTADLIRISEITTYPYYEGEPLSPDYFDHDPSEWYPPDDFEDIP